VVGGVVFIDFVEDLGVVAERYRPVGKTGGDIKLMFIVFIQGDFEIFFIVRAVFSEIDHDIYNRAPFDVHQFGLSLRVFLKMHPANSVFMTAEGMIVLNEGIGNAVLMVFFVVVAFVEKAAVILEDIGLDDEDFGQGGFNYIHINYVPVKGIGAILRFLD